METRKKKKKKKIKKYISYGILCSIRNVVRTFAIIIESFQITYPIGTLYLFLQENKLSLME